MPAIEIFTAWRVRCYECRAAIVLRSNLDETRYHRRCPACRSLLPQSTVLLERLREKAVELRSFDCDQCGRETVLAVDEEIRCRFCGE